MNTRFKIIDYITPELKFSLSEASEVDGTHILAKIKGEFFVPNGVSRNKRFYPASLWEKVIQSPIVKQKLKDRLMFGTVGHDGEIGEKAIREGLISHIMTSIIIENGKGIGEALILNTPTGRILNTLLRAGCNLRVSSRANGTFRGEQNGLPVVDEDNYDLEGWDFVIEAGFLEANPSLAESFKNLQKNVNNETLSKTGDFMSEKTIETTLVQHVVDENAELKKQVSKMTEELDAVKADKEVTEKELADAKADSEESEKKLEKLKKYEEVGEPEEVKAKLDDAEKNEEELEKFKELGDSPEEVKEALATAKKHLSYIRENFGTVPEIRKALTESVNFKAKVDALGTLDAIAESLSTLNKLVEEEEEKKADADAQSLADEVDMEKEDVKEMLKTQTAESIRSFHKKMTESLAKKTQPTTTSDNSRFAKTEPKTIVEGTEKKPVVEGENRNEKTRLERMNERLSR